MAAPRHVLAVLVAVLVALAAACGGGGGGEDLTAGLTPQEILDRSAERAREAGPFRIALDLSGDVALPPGAPGRPLPGGALDVRGEGPVGPPDRASIDASVELGGLRLQVNLTVVERQLFLGALGQDFRLRGADRVVDALDLGALYPTLAGWVRSPSLAGRQEVDGMEAVRVRGPVDPEAALADLVPLLGGEAPAPGRARDLLDEGTVEAWVGTEDLLPRRVRLVLRAHRMPPPISQTVRSLDLELAADLTDWGEEVEIVAPADAEDLRLDQLGSLGGG